MNDDVFGPAEEAHRYLVEAIYGCLRGVALRRQDDLPGIHELVFDQILVNMSRPTRGALGYFAPDSWDLDGLAMSEIHLNADRGSARRQLSRGEDLLVTIVHELAHAYAYYNGIKDTSNRGRYHNRRFGEIAVLLGLRIARNGDYRGYGTSQIAASYYDEYSDLVETLSGALVLRTNPRIREAGKAAATTVGAGGDAPAQGSPKYVFATCSCNQGRGTPRTVRVAAGSWAHNSIFCGICGRAFTSESLTASGQTQKRPQHRSPLDDSPPPNSMPPLQRSPLEPGFWT